MKNYYLVFILVLMIFLIGCSNTTTTSKSGGNADSDGEPIEVTFAEIYDVNHPMTIKANEIAEEFNAATNGRYEMKVHPSAILGSMESNDQDLATGAIGMTILGNPYASKSYPPIQVASAPYAFRGVDHLLAYFESDLYDELIGGYEEETGNKVLGAGYYGARNTTSNFQINTPEDMEALRIRVPDAPMYQAMAVSVGASPTVIDFNEVYLALQRGIVEAQENPLPTIYDMSFHEVQEYINLTRHLIDHNLFVASPHFWNSLSKEDQDILKEIVDRKMVELAELVIEEENELMEKFRDLGNIVNEDVDIEAFMKKAESYNTDPERPWSSEQYYRLQEIQ